jgi:hypothetical protein
MVKGKVVTLGIGIIFLFLILSWLILPRLGFEIEFLSSPYGMILISVTGMLLAISGFLPDKLGAILREVALFCLFITILLVEINIVKPFVKATTVDMKECQKYFQPSTTGEVVYDALKYTSCVLTGYFPSTEGDLGWTVFYIFYLILPFAFIWVLLYGIMKSIMEDWFPVQFNVSALLSFIIALYASRTLMGGFLLEFAGYGAWGLGAIFLAIIFTKGLDKIMKDWYKTEEMGKEVKGVIQEEIERERAFAQSALPLIKRVKELGSDENNKTNFMAAKNMLGTIRNNPIWNMLSKDAQNTAEWFILEAQAADTSKTFLYYVNEMEKFLKRWAKPAK